jgi:hypothetical protein
MNRFCIFIGLLCAGILCFAQQNFTLKITGRIPSPDDVRLYQIQVGAFKVPANAENLLGILTAASLNAGSEKYLDFTRVVVNGIGAGEVPACLEKLKSLGFSEVFIKIDVNTAAALSALRLPVSTAALPSGELKEIANRNVKVGETKSLADLAEGRNVAYWVSSTPSSIRVDSTGNITGLKVGNGFISINETEYISVAVVPQEAFYVVPESEAALLPKESKTGNTDTGDLTEYATEPTFRLAYRFRNKGEEKGASGGNGGVDILARGADYEWLWTTYYQGGWFYNLNGEMREMINGRQRSANSVTLTVKPEFIYADGVPYLQLKHFLYNPNNHPVEGQKFGASADVMIHKNDSASLLHTPYGASMADSLVNPSLTLMFVAESGNGITPVDTLWLGTYGSGHLNYIFNDRRVDIHNADSAIGFSYQNIYLRPNETKEFVVRFTLARNED